MRLQPAIPHRSNAPPPETKLSITKAKALAKEITAEKRTSELLMGENECGLEGLMAIASAFEKNTSISSFALISTCPGRSSARLIARGSFGCER